MPLALSAGAPPALVAGVVLAFGAFGFNGVLYLLAGELAGSTRAGRAVGIASTVVFGMGALAAPIAGVAIERTGYDAVWVISAIAAAAGAITRGAGSSRRPSWPPRRTSCRSQRPLASVREIGKEASRGQDQL